MTNTIETKFKIGDIVWLADSSREEIRETCPDCLGTRYWSVTTPAGDEFECDCDTCRLGYEVRGFVTRWDFVGRAPSLTIGSVRVDTDDEKHAVSYMAIETGVGTGLIWYEPRLFASKDDALKAAEARALELQEDARKRAVNSREQAIKKEKRKPSFERRRIRVLEKEVAALRKESAAA